jgi:hypothetical protein
MTAGLAEFLEMQGQIFECFQQNVTNGFRLLTEQLTEGGGPEGEEEHGSAEQSGSGAGGSRGDMEMDS